MNDIGVMKAVRVKELFSKKNYEEVIVFIEKQF